MPLYGTQVMARPGQAALGYGPAGQAYNTENPVAMTTSGVRPLSVAMNRVAPHNAPAGSVSAATQWQMANPLPGSRMGRETAGREQAQYGYDRYGNVAPGGQTGGMGGVGSYNSGLTAGIVPPSVVQQAFGRMGVAGPGAGTVNTQYDDLMRQGMNQIGTQFGRDAAFDMANLNLARQRAQGDLGLGYGNLLARLFEGNLANQRAQQNLSGDFLMGLLG